MLSGRDSTYLGFSVSCEGFFQNLKLKSVVSSKLLKEISLNFQESLFA